MAAVRSVREDVMAAIKKSDDKRDEQHQELLGMIRALQGRTSQSRMDVPPFDDRPPDDHHGAGTDHDGTDPVTRRGQPPTETRTTEARTPDTVSDQQGHDATSREEMAVDTETAVFEQILPEELTTVRTSQLLPDPIHIQDLTPAWSPKLPDPIHMQDLTPAWSSQLPPDRRGLQDLTPARNRALQPRITGSSSDRRHPEPSSATEPSSRSTGTDLVLPDPHDLERTPAPPPLRRGSRHRVRGWMERTPYTDPCRPKRPRIMPPPPHEWMPTALVDPDQLEAYMAFKWNTTGEL